MKTYWQNLNERERWMVSLAIIALLFYLFYGVLYSPLINQLDKKYEQLNEKRTTLQWMKQINPENITGNKQKKLSNNQLTTLISTELKNSSTLKFPYQLQQTSSGEIQLSFDKVPFQYILTWLSNLKENYYFTIKQFNVEKTETLGVTKISLILGANP